MDCIVFFADRYDSYTFLPKNQILQLFFSSTVDKRKEGASVVNENTGISRRV